MKEVFRKGNITFVLCENASRLPTFNTCVNCSLRAVKKPSEVLVCTSNRETYSRFNPRQDSQQAANTLVGGLALLALLVEVAFGIYKLVSTKPKRREERREEEEEWVA